MFSFCQIFETLRTKQKLKKNTSAAQDTFTSCYCQYFRKQWPRSWSYIGWRRRMRLEYSFVAQRLQLSQVVLPLILLNAIATVIFTSTYATIRTIFMMSILHSFSLSQLSGTIHVDTYISEFSAKLTFIRCSCRLPRNKKGQEK